MGNCASTKAVANPVALDAAAAIPVGDVGEKDKKDLVASEQKKESFRRLSIARLESIEAQKVADQEAGKNSREEIEKRVTSSCPSCDATCNADPPCRG